MTELSFIYDQPGYLKADKEEQDRVEAAWAETKSAKSDTPDPSHITLERVQALAAEGLSKIAPVIGEEAVSETVRIVNVRHSVGHNSSLPETLFREIATD